ncbi:hypothetical protein [Aeromicrobium sp. CTD01-1L150]|uniref:hypothetical protein n=1 Tax=Aeromicrobium sp. CTD01-1L150 TaxID=3341830 RepID=UPI0035C24A6B
MNQSARAFQAARRAAIRAPHRPAVTLEDVEAAFGPRCGEARSVSAEVPLRRVVGTLARAEDFDRELRPTRSHVAQRWHSVHRAHTQSQHLGCVSLLQTGDFYLIVDGHHRASVARAADQLTIDACVQEVCTHRPACLACLPEDAE